MASNLNEKPTLVGVVGYSATRFNKVLGEELVKKSFDELEKIYGRNITIVSGLTNLGIPALAYKEAVNRGWKTCGIACERAKNFKCFKCDEVILVGARWGDESLTFLKKIDVIVKIGGGKQSINEFELAKKMSITAFEYDLPRE